MARLGEPPLVITFSRMYPRALYPGESDRGDGGFPADLEVLPLLDGFDPLSFRRAAERRGGARGAARGVGLLDLGLRAPPRPLPLLAPRRGAGRGPPPPLPQPRRPRGGRAPEGARPRSRSGGPTSSPSRTRATSRRRGARCPRRAPSSCPTRPSRAPIVPRRGGARAPRPPGGRAGLPLQRPPPPLQGVGRPSRGVRRGRSARSPTRSSSSRESRGARRRLLAARPAPPGVRLFLRFLPAEERGLLFDACDAVVCPYRHATGSGIAADAVAHGTARHRLGRPGPRRSSSRRGSPASSSRRATRTPSPRRCSVSSARGWRRASPPGPPALGARFTPEGHARAILALGGIAS